MKFRSKSVIVAETSATLHMPGSFPWRMLEKLTVDLSQYLSDEDVSKLQAIIRNRDVQAYLDLGEVWGLQSFNTHEYSDFENSKAKYALASLLKKFQFSGSREARQAAAIEKFNSAEAQCRSFNRTGWKELMSHEEPWIHVAIYHARRFLERLLGPLPEVSALTLWSRHGPGATTDTKRGHVSKYNKDVDFPYQCTAAALRHAKALIRNDERWLGALEDQYRQLNGIAAHAILDRKVFWETVLKVVPGAEIHFVPKNAKTFRTITIEPTLNVYLQLGVDGFMRRRLKRWHVDLDDQSWNQLLARLGSMNSDDPYVTLDLSAASDTVSLKIVELLFPVDWYLYLLDLRSPQANLNGEPCYFQKFSAMGNGFTFVLESAIFTALIYGVMVATNNRFDRKDFAVYGDDLIIRKSLSERLVTLLQVCGFTINREKSFLEGSQRESCGSDWSRGLPVRPVFLEDTPTDIKQLFSAINRVKRYLDLRWGIQESKAVQMMTQWVPETFRDCIGPLSDTDFDSYLHSEVGGVRPAFMYGSPGVREHLRVDYVPVKQSGCSLLSFRKLMHPLRETPEPKGYGSGTDSGSAFTVHVRSKNRAVRKETSVAWNWRTEYAEVLPV